MRPVAAALLFCALVAAGMAAGCGRDTLRLGSSRSTSFSNARLVTQFAGNRSEPELPLFHILFVPAVQPSPGSGFGMTGSSGGTADDLKFDYAYHEFGGSNKPTIQSRPIHVRNLKTLEAEGQSFDLAKGSIFVAHVARDGHLNVIQLPSAASQHDPAPAAILDVIKRAAPSDTRIQRLPSR